MRRTILTLVLALLPSLATQAQTLPVDREDLIPASPSLIKALSDSAEFLLRWKPPANAAEWHRRRPAVELAFRRSIGLASFPERTPLNSRITATHDFGDYTVQNVIFESRPGFPVTGNVYRSKTPAQGKRPAVLCPIGHYLSAGKTEPDIQARCIKLARMGFVVLVYDAIGQGERMVPGNIHHEAGYSLLPLGETIAGWMVWDSMRGIDYLLSLSEVDPKRIGVTGNSGGGLNTLYTSAVDSRVAASVIVGYTFEFNNWVKYAGAHCTCTHLPAIFRSMEWFEIAGLIAPRAVMMIQGEQDAIFPISGARRAGHNTEHVYNVLGQEDKARFVALPRLPHAYSRPYRERMYGWMAKHLLGKGKGDPIDEGEVQTLPEKDARLLCDPERKIIPLAPSVVDIARRRGLDATAKLTASRDKIQNWIHQLTAPPEDPLPYLLPEREKPEAAKGGTVEKISFMSEDGSYIPGLLWLPEKRISPAKTIVIVDARGKAEVAKSDFVPPLIAEGFSVLALDLRGRGETLGLFRPTWDTNFRLVANQVLFGEPLSGRRAYDLIRAVDFLDLRKDLGSSDVTVVGLGDDALPALLATAADSRIRRVAVSGFVRSWVSQMKPMVGRPVPNGWNDAQLQGRIYGSDYDVDLGSVIPSALEIADIPDLVAFIAPRRALFAQVRDGKMPDTEAIETRFKRTISSAASGSIQYQPNEPLDVQHLRDWLQQQAR